MAPSATTISLQSLAQHIPGTVGFTQEIAVGNVPADAIEHESWMDDLARSYDAHWLPQELDFEVEIDSAYSTLDRSSTRDIPQEDTEHQHSKTCKGDWSMPYFNAEDAVDQTPINSFQDLSDDNDINPDNLEDSGHMEQFDVEDTDRRAQNPHGDTEHDRLDGGTIKGQCSVDYTSGDVSNLKDASEHGSYERSGLEDSHLPVVTAVTNDQVRQVPDQDDPALVEPSQERDGKKPAVIFPRRGSILDLHHEDAAAADLALAYKPLFLQSRERFICNILSPASLQARDEPVQYVPKMKARDDSWENAEEYLRKMREKILAYAAAHPRKRH